MLRKGMINMKWIIFQSICWVAVGIISLIACLTGLAAEWTTFWCIYGGLIINLFTNACQSIIVKKLN